MRPPIVTALALAAACSSTSKPPPPGGGSDDGGAPIIDGPPPGQGCAGGGFGAWTGHDDLPASQMPPCGIAPSAAPMFVSIGFDDNGDPDGMTWALDMLKARGLHTSFYMTSVYGQSDAVVAIWKRVRAEGHEIANHTVTHLPNHGGHDYTGAQWMAELGPCSDFLVGHGVVPASEIYGFRTPYLEYDDAMLQTVAAAGLRYDCSIEEGYEDGHDGSNEYWPYTLDHLSPGHTAQVQWMDPANPIKELTPHPGLWEMPVYAVFVPPDDKCAQYGVPSGLRARLQARQSWFDTTAGSITGFDYNLWASVPLGGFEVTKAEYLAIMEYTFDQHRTGNHAPVLFGSHPAYYVDSWSQNAPGTPLTADRRAAVEEYVDYVIGKGGTIAPHEQILEWMRNPK